MSIQKTPVVRAFSTIPDAPRLSSTLILLALNPRDQLRRGKCHRFALRKIIVIPPMESGLPKISIGRYQVVIHIQQP